MMSLWSAITNLAKALTRLADVTNAIADEGSSEWSVFSSGRNHVNTCTQEPQRGRSGGTLSPGTGSSSCSAGPLERFSRR